MALVRILVDGYSLLHQWLELARASRAIRPCREELISRLTRYYDASGTPVSLFLMGKRDRQPGSNPFHPGSGDHLFAGRQSADQLIERRPIVSAPLGGLGGDG